MKLVTLTMAECMQAASAGSVRRLTSMKEGHDKNKHADKSDWATDIDGAAAEMAFAKLNNFYWSASNRTFKEPDVGVWHIRSTTRVDGHLIIRPNDEDPEALFVFAVTNLPRVSIYGWIVAHEAKTDRYWRQDKNGWWVPQEALVQLQA